jgi:hypothetical protein
MDILICPNTSHAIYRITGHAVSSLAGIVVIISEQRNGFLDQYLIAHV